MKLKPIETVYKDYRFRSRLEARWAVFFDTMGFEWDYEPEGFDLGDGLYYLPDFWFPKVNMWGEIKPKDKTFELNKLQSLSKNSGFPVLMLIGLPDYCAYYAIQCDKCNQMFEIIDYYLVNHYYPNHFPGGNYLNPKYKNLFGEDYRLAIKSAKSARFEHGDRYQIPEISN